MLFSWWQTHIPHAWHSYFELSHALKHMDMSCHIVEQCHSVGRLTHVIVVINVILTITTPSIYAKSFSRRHRKTIFAYSEYKIPTHFEYGAHLLRNKWLTIEKTNPKKAVCLCRFRRRRRCRHREAQSTRLFIVFMRIANLLRNDMMCSTSRIG